MMAKPITALNEIVSVLKAGAIFYHDAAQQCADTGLGQAFGDMAQTRSAAAQELAAIVSELDTEPASPHWGEQARAAYATLKAQFGGRDEDLLDALIEHEDRTLASIKSALDTVDHTQIRPVLLRHYETFFGTHKKLSKFSLTASR
jgi:uncharacterized protein (TIGR02284 family)